MENRREVRLTGFSNNALDDVLRSNNNEPNAPNSNPGGMIASAHAITKDAKIVSLEGEFNEFYGDFPEQVSSFRYFSLCHSMIGRYRGRKILDLWILNFLSEADRRVLLVNLIT